MCSTCDVHRYQDREKGVGWGGGRVVVAEDAGSWHTLLEAAKRRPDVARELEADRTAALTALTDIQHCTQLLTDLAAGRIRFAAARVAAGEAVMGQLHVLFDLHPVVLAGVLTHAITAAAATAAIHVALDRQEVDRAQAQALRGLSSAGAEERWRALAALEDFCDTAHWAADELIASSRIDALCALLDAYYNR